MRAILLVLLGLLVACEGAARDFLVEPGDVPELRPGEGFVLVAVDTDVDLRYVSVKSATKLFTGDRLRDIAKGRNWGLYVMPAGDYRWDSLHAGWVRWVMREEPEFQFQSRAGEITYAGDLIYHGIRFHVANRGLSALDWLEREHPEIAARYPFVYSGHYPDPFPAFYREQRAGRAGNPTTWDKTTSPPPVGDLPFDPALLWKQPRLGAVALSPDGLRVVAAVREERPANAAELEDRRIAAARWGKEPDLAAPAVDWSLDLYDLEAGEVKRLVDARGPVASLAWLDDGTVLAGIEVDRLRAPHPYLLRRGQDGRWRAMQMPRPGRVVSALANEPGRVLFASTGSRGEALVHRVDIRSDQALASEKFLYRDRLNAGLERDHAWFSDAAGRIRAALVSRDESTVLVHGGGGTYRDVMVLDDPEGFQPMAVSGDGSRIFGTLEKGRGQRDLVELDPATGQVTRTVFSKPGRDVAGPVFGAGNTPIGARYLEAGQLVTEYFDAERAGVAASLQRAFPERTVLVQGRSDDGQRVLLWVDGTDQPPALYHLDRKAGRASLVDAAAPWLDGLPMAPSLPMTVTSRDGLEVEAFLTLPPGEAPRPLVVMPHGGPIGVADSRHFTPEVQLLASMGYAVLQVNFRGSEGYGRAFEQAGHGGFGRGIEDDIAAATEAALARHPLDPDRVCMVGASYGGYSSLISSVRWPGRFRCVASISGVSDRALFFTASDAGRNAETRKVMERIIGDPRRQLDEMRETSPLFRYRELTTPVLLVHGTRDIRVDYEHTRRLVRMLGMAGRPPALLVLEEEGHQLDGEGALVDAWTAVAGFLRQHLDGQGDRPAPAP